MTELRKSEFDFELKAEGETGEIVGYASIFKNVDQSNDRVMPGAFDKWKSRGIMPKMLWQHRADSPIGKWEKAEITKKGLKLSGKLILGIPTAKEVYEYVKEGIVEGLSIGYRLIKYDIGDDGVWNLEEIDVKETSIVTFPANERATITSVKTRLTSAKDVERILHEANVPNSFAKLVAKHGFDKAQATVLEQREAAKSTQENIRREMKLLRSKLNAT